MDFLKNKLTALILVVVLIGLLGGCGNKPSEDIHYNKVIPDSLKTVAVEKVKEILETIKVNSRVDDEDMEYWIREAKQTVIDLYGVETVGIYAKTQSHWEFVPYNKCSDEQKKMIDRYLVEQR